MILIIQTELLINNIPDKKLPNYQNISLHEFDLDAYRERIYEHLETQYGKRITDNPRNPKFEINFKYLQIKTKHNEQF